MTVSAHTCLLQLKSQDETLQLQITNTYSLLKMKWHFSVEKEFFNIPDVCFSAIPFSTNNFGTHPVGSSCDRLHSCTRETDSLQSFAGTEVTELHIACWIPQNICSWKEGNTALPSWKTQGFGVGNSNRSLDSVIQFNINLGFPVREFTFSARSYYSILENN